MTKKVKYIWIHLALHSNTLTNKIQNFKIHFRKLKCILQTLEKYFPQFQKLFFSNRIVVFAGNGYISTDTLKEILKELDSKLTNEDLENIIEEVDEDGSGTLDFDEFMEMMAG